MKILALAAVASTVMGLVLILCSVQVGETLLISGMSTLAFVAFMLAHIFPCPYMIDDEDYARGTYPMWNFSMRLTGWSLAIGIMGLLFWLMHWPGGIMMLIIGGGALACSGIAWLFLFHLKRKSNNKS